MSYSILPTMRNVLDKIVEKFKTSMFCSIAFFFERRALWNNMDKRCTAVQATYDNMARVHVPTSTSSICNNNWFSSSTMVSWRLSVTLCLQCLSCLFVDSKSCIWWPFRTRHMFIWTFFLTITDSITFQMLTYSPESPCMIKTNGFKRRDNCYVGIC
jgi:hypothetical protein